jgi:hypothetical protein
MENRFGQVTIFIIVALFLVGAVVLAVWLNAGREPELQVVECSIDSDCVPSTCCDAQLCTGKQDAPDCAYLNPILGRRCALGCYSFDNKYLGCDADGDGNGEGVCVCENRKCVPSFST